ncbi:MAG: hypothetical protein L0216_03475 [Planctomycetales bacterium]|nr:hypothetical protein [Planctomycetales bacterium]
MSRPILVATALAAEARAVRALSLPGVQVVRAGPGPERVRAAAPRALASEPAAVLAVGLAGGLDPDLASGVLVAPEGGSLEAGKTSWIADPGWRPRLVRCGASGGTGVTVALPVLRPAEKRALRARTGARICEMEDAAWADAAAVRGIPFASLRVVLDAAADEPPDLGPAAEPDGATTPAGLARLLRPDVLIRLPGLALKVRALTRALARSLEAALAD